MKKNLLFLFLFLPLFIYAQDDNAIACDGQRYYQEIFEEVQLTTVFYGQNIDYQDNLVELYMDVYEPVGDEIAERPAVVLAHGGAWVGGTREDMAEVCINLAKRGYVATSLSYRLYEPDFFNIPDSIGALDIMLKSVGDMKAAIRHLRLDAATENQFRVDTERIYAGGASAGGIMATHVGYLDENDNIPDYVLQVIEENGGFEGNTGDENNLMYSSDIQGVMSLSGGLYKREWINEGDIPLLMVHGTEDDIVPYAHGMLGANLNGIQLDLVSLDGSSVLAARAEEVGLTYLFQPVEGGMHDNIYLAPEFEEDRQTFYENAYQFFFDLNCPDFEIVSTSAPELELPITISPNPSSSKIQVQISDNSSAYFVQVYNQIGRLQKTISMNNSSFELSKEELGLGVFYLHILDKETGQSTSKLVLFQ